MKTKNSGLVHTTYSNTLPSLPPTHFSSSVLLFLAWTVIFYGLDMGSWQWNGAHRWHYSHHNLMNVDLMQSGDPDTVSSLWAVKSFLGGHPCLLGQLVCETRSNSPSTLEEWGENTEKLSARQGHRSGVERLGRLNHVRPLPCSLEFVRQLPTASAQIAS